MGYVSISKGIVTLLETITEISETYNHEPKELGQFPCATVTSLEHNNTVNDLAANRRVYTHVIRCYYRTDIAEDAETILRGIADKVIETIEANISLDGSCDFSSPTRGRWGYVDREIPLRYFEINVDAYTRVVR
jgi:hypothetical protein